MDRFHSIAGHFYPIADHLKVIGDGKKVIAGHFDGAERTANPNPRAHPPHLLSPLLRYTRELHALMRRQARRPVAGIDSSRPTVERRTAADVA